MKIMILVSLSLNNAKKGCDKIGCFTSLSVTLVLTITKFNISKS